MNEANKAVRAAVHDVVVEILGVLGVSTRKRWIPISERGPGELRSNCGYCSSPGPFWSKSSRCRCYKRSLNNRTQAKLHHKLERRLLLWLGRLLSEWALAVESESDFRRYVRNQRGWAAGRNGFCW